MIEKIAYAGLPNCYRAYNETIELIASSDTGPRILHFGFIGEWNEFVPAQKHGFSGHRLWHAPEAFPRSYVSDDRPVEFTQHTKFFSLTQSPEKETGIQKEMDISINPEKNHLTVVHRLYNRGALAGGNRALGHFRHGRRRQSDFPAAGT